MKGNIAFILIIFIIFSLAEILEYSDKQNEQPHPK